MFLLISPSGISKTLNELLNEVFFKDLNISKPKSGEKLNII